MENELIIRYKGKEYDFELTERDADHISDLTSYIECAPFDPDPPESKATSLTYDQQQQIHQRFAEYDKVAIDFQATLKRIANLDESKIPMLFALLDLIELGDLDGTESNWALEFIEQVLRSVVRNGAAGALHRDPRTFLASLSYHMSCYWRWVKESRDVVKFHPELFPTPPPEPEPAKKRSPRKRSRKAAA